MKEMLMLFVILSAGILLSGCEDDSSGSRDEKDISNAVMLFSNDPEIHKWPITSTMAPFEHDGRYMLCEWDKRTVWPTSAKNTVVANIVIFYELNGTLYGCPQEYITNSNPWRSMRLWLPDGRGGKYRPRAGTTLWLMISGISSVSEPNNIKERTQVQEVIWPINS